LFNENNIDVYYGYKLVDCLFANKNILIDLHIPLINKNTNTKLVQMKPVYFSYKDATSKLTYKERQIAVIFNNLNEMQIKNIECNVFIDNICYLSEMQQLDFIPCVKTILQKSIIGNINKNCEFTCLPLINKLKIQKKKFQHIFSFKSFSILSH
jgi:hypothetical protein